MSAAELLGVFIFVVCLVGAIVSAAAMINKNVDETMRETIREYMTRNKLK